MQVNSEKAFVNMIWKFCERFGLQMVTFVVSIVLARILSPEEYGIITIVLVLLSIADVFVTGGFGNALIQKKNVDELDFSSVFYFNLAFSVFVYAISKITTMVHHPVNGGIPLTNLLQFLF